MTVRDEDVEYAFDDPDDGWFGMARPADVTLARPAEEPARDHWTDDASQGSGHGDASDHYEDPSEDTDRWFVQDMILATPAELEDPPRVVVDDRPASESVAATLNVVPTRRNGFVNASASSAWESRLSESSGWDFTATSGGNRDRSRAVLMAAAIIAGVLGIVGIVLLLRSPAPAVEESTPVAPSESAAPWPPTTSAPALSSNVPLPPPGPPPPPSAEELIPPVVTRQYTPRYQTPDQPKKLQTNVTRAPLSATPPPRNTDKGRATPGESGSHGFFG